VIDEVFRFLEEHQAALLWGSGVLLVAGLTLDALRQVLDEDDRDPEKERRP
jgi:hypothetical protein